MTVTPVVLLRLMLPPGRDIASAPLRAAWCDAQGVWQGDTFATPDAVAARFATRRLEICPHPSDLSMTDLTLPPLRPRQLHLAITGAIELLALTPPTQLVVGYGAREEAGTVPVAWMTQACLAQILQALRQAGLQPDAVLPPPAFLPQPDEGHAVVLAVDGWAIVRRGASAGGLYPLPMQTVDAERSSRLQKHLPADTGIVWMARDAASEGEGWGWGLTLNRAATAQASTRWLRPALIWSAVALVVWLGGLRLQAQMLEAQGLELKRQMTAQVKAAFPGLTMVINPLQQARQLREARDAGTGDTPADFTALLRAAAALLPQMDNQVQQLNYQQGQLAIRWREGAALRKEEAAALQTQAQERQLAATADARGVTFSAAPPAPEPGS